MDYRRDIERSLEFIEAHIREDLTPEAIADNVGYSVFHFCRVFSRCKGVPLMDYVRKRRLALARRELLFGRRITDLAFEYGFDTASGFSKAFRREFGYSPTTYAARMNAYVKSDESNSEGGYVMQPVFVDRPAFKVAGYGIQTNIEGDYTRDIAAYWSHYEGENLENKMYLQLSPPEHGEVGICIPSSDSGSVVYLLGVIVEDFERVPPDMMTVEVPEARYAVFTTPPVDATGVGAYEDAAFAGVIRETWRYIFEEWFRNSGYVYDEEKLDYEFYDERCHLRPNTVAEIYVPVKRKK